MFVVECKNSTHKVVQDWIANKDSIPWFFPSFNPNLSKISKENWATTPGDTNINESAHSYTNQHTGTNLALLDACRLGYQHDLERRATPQAAESSTVLPNHLNGGAKRTMRNTRRRGRNHEKTIAAQVTRTQLEEIENGLAELTQQRRDLQQRKKDLKTTTGIKKTVKAGKKQRAYLPSDAEMSGTVGPVSEMQMDESGEMSEMDFEAMENFGSFGVGDFKAGSSVKPVHPIATSQEELANFHATVAMFLHVGMYGRWPEVTLSDGLLRELADFEDCV
uniref:Tc1-like transposase DDE domain-containing protein n=1 Tax=Mycena chlorophos TaxID=658473 RepID=A0ABQ0KX49_MYCCL|nr:predicted protein [Mycena chlorophos]